MRARPLIGLVVLLFGSVLLHANSTLPDPSTYIDANYMSYMSVLSQNGAGQCFSGIGCGGSFNATFQNPTQTGPSWASSVWCVDSQNDFYYATSPNNPANAFVIKLDQIAANANKVQYGSGATFTYNAIDTGSGDVALTSVLQRYQMAAYLVQYGYHYGAGGIQEGIDNTGAAAQNSAVQQAIWDLLHATSGAAGFIDTSTAMGPGELLYSSSDTTSAYWLAQAALNYGQQDFSHWAVVSWVAQIGKDGQPYIDPSQQAFLVQAAPEPGFYGILAIGLAGLFTAISRRKK